MKEPNRPVQENTLLFLVKKEGDQIKEICLAMKKRGFGLGKWNGVGGKLEKGESPEEAAIRECREEVGVEVKILEKAGELTFFFKENPNWDQFVHVYLSDNWDGDPVETEEMSPKWYKIDEIPFNAMWSDDIYWIPKVLDGKKVKGEFIFEKNDILVVNKLEVV